MQLYLVPADISLVVVKNDGVIIYLIALRACAFNRYI